MTTPPDDFDTELDGDTGLEGHEEGRVDMMNDTSAPKKSGGGALPIILIVAVVGGLGFAVKSNLIHLPFRIPGLSPAQARTAVPRMPSASNGMPSASNAISSAPSASGATPGIVAPDQQAADNTMPPMPGAAAITSPGAAAATSSGAEAAISSGITPPAGAAVTPPPVIGSAPTPVVNIGGLPPAIAAPGAPGNAAITAPAAANAPAANAGAPEDPLNWSGKTPAAPGAAIAPPAAEAAPGISPPTENAAVPAGISPPAQNGITPPAQNTAPASAQNNPAQNGATPATEAAPDMAAPPADDAVPAATANTAANTAAAAASAAQEKKIATLEQQVTDLKATISRLEKEKPVKPASRIDGGRAAAAPAPVRHSVAQTRSSGGASASHHILTAPKSAPVSAAWVLKSAKPGTAWVASPGSSELKTVSVGDTLPGIGRITAVSQDAGGQWVVNGTKGKINQ